MYFKSGIKKNILLCISVLLIGGLIPITAFAQDAEIYKTPDLINLQKQIDTLKNKVETLEKEQQEKDALIRTMSAERMATIEPAAGGDDRANINWNPVPAFTSDDGRFSFQLNSRLAYDYANVSYKDGDGLSRPDEKVNGTNLRYLELGFRGKLFGDFSYRLATKFVNNEVEVKLAYVDYETGNTKITLGQTRTYTSLDKLTPPTNHTFSERFAFINALRIKPRIGIAASQHGENWSVSGGYFFENAATSGNSLDDNNMASGRVTFSPRFENGLGLHLGSSFFFRNENGFDFSGDYSTRPLSKQGDLKPLFSGDFEISSEKFIGAEFAATYGSFGFQAEYARVNNALSSTETQTSVNPTYQGGYVEVGFFPTGGERVIDGTDGRYDSVKIKNPVGEGGMGELRLAARYDFADFTHETFGRKQTSMMLSADWYLNEYMKIQANYAHSIVKDYQNIKTDTVDTFNLRYIFSF